MTNKKAINAQLCDAIEDGDLSKAIAALDAGASPNARHLGDTPLQYACRQANANMVVLLKSRGANLNATDDEGEYCFAYIPSLSADIPYNARAATIKNLLMLGMDKDAYYESGGLVSHWCARHLNADDLRLVLQMKLELHLPPDEEDRNITHHLVSNTRIGSDDMIWFLKFFTRAGIDVHEQCGDGRTPRALAHLLGNERFMEAIKRFDAEQTRTILEAHVPSSSVVRKGSKL